ncbi:MAG: molecular chaperone Tir [Clostridia bacterium]|nr:molecular chaperone Tir [Clostridia bacterium]
MTYRTKTYIAGDWTGDSDAISTLYRWKNSGYLNFDFVDAHELTQARDTSLNCSIKKSLKERLDASKTFVLVVGANTKDLRAGSCSYCNSLNSWTSTCARGYSVDRRNYIDYECEKAKEAGIRIVVLYNYSNVYRDKCPDSLRCTGTHVAMISDGRWDYASIKKAIEG